MGIKDFKKNLFAFDLIKYLKYSKKNKNIAHLDFPTIKYLVADSILKRVEIDHQLDTELIFDQLVACLEKKVINKVKGCIKIIIYLERGKIEKKNKEHIIRKRAQTTASEDVRMLKFGYIIANDSSKILEEDKELYNNFSNNRYYKGDSKEEKNTLQEFKNYIQEKYNLDTIDKDKRELIKCIKASKSNINETDEIDLTESDKPSPSGIWVRHAIRYDSKLKYKIFSMIEEVILSKKEYFEERNIEIIKCENKDAEFFIFQNIRLNYNDYFNIIFSIDQDVLFFMSNIAEKNCGLYEIKDSCKDIISLKEDPFNMVLRLFTLSNSDYFYKMKIRFNSLLLHNKNILKGGNNIHFYYNDVKKNYIDYMKALSCSVSIKKDVDTTTKNILEILQSNEKEYLEKYFLSYNQYINVEDGFYEHDILENENVNIPNTQFSIKYKLFTKSLSKDGEQLNLRDTIINLKDYSIIVNKKYLISNYDNFLYFINIGDIKSVNFFNEEDSLELLEMDDANIVKVSNRLINFFFSL